MSVVRLVKEPLYSVSVVSESTLHPVPASSDGCAEGASGTETMIYRAHFVKKRSSLSDAVHFLSDFKPRFLESFSASTEKGLHSVVEEAHSDNLLSGEDGTESRAVPRQANSQDRAAPATPAGPS